jgi:ribosome biogenesis GTPase
MDKKQRRRLRSMLAELDTSERNKLKKRAAKLRKAALRTRGPNGPKLELEDFLLELVAAELGNGDGAGAPEGAGGERAVVTGIAAGVSTVLLKDGETQAALPSSLAGRQQSDLAVGDEVLVERHGEGHRVTAVLPRRSLLSRADPRVSQRRRAIAANVDLVVVVVAADAPPLHPRLIDRYLVAVEQSGARPLLVVNKVDLFDTDRRHELLAMLQPYRSLGMPVLPCSAERGEGIEAVREALAGHTCVFVGQSGVGKSSLLNALDGEAAAKTGAVRDRDGRGRHTTAASSLYDIAGDIRVIDTPGIRRFSVESANQTTIAAGFVEFAPYVDDCRYRDCTHVHEPDCAVRRAVSDGSIPRSRYVSYRKLLGGDGDDPRATDDDPAPAGAAKSCGSAGPGGGDGAHGGHFTCSRCGRPVPFEGAGSGHRNHCPHCLHSVHLDDVPGDRAACCGGVMEPVTVWVRRAGEWALVHRCRTCGKLSSNRIAGDDNEALLLSLAVKPLSAPPFPLDGLAGWAASDAGVHGSNGCTTEKLTADRPAAARPGGGAV